MVSLELLIDATGMQRGAQQAATALDGVATKATATERSVTTLGRSMTNAFQATGGTVQVAQGISQTAQALSQMNVAAASISGARVFLEIGRVGQDLAGLGGRFGALGAAIARFNPLLFIATTALSGISLAMQLFGRNTDTTTRAVEKQTDAIGAMIARARELDIRAGYGEADPRRTAGGIVDQLTKLRLSSTSSLPISDAAGLFGVSEQDFRLQLAQSGLGEAAFEGRTVRVPSRTEAGFSTDIYGRQVPTRIPVEFRDEFQYSRGTFSRQEVIAAGERLLSQSRSPGEIGPPLPTGGVLDPDAVDKRYAGVSDPSVLFPGLGTEKLHEAETSMRELNYQAQAFASTLGGAAAALVTGAATTRDILMQLIGSGVQSGFQAGFGAIAQGFASGFNATSTQVRTPGVS